MRADKSTNSDLNGRTTLVAPSAPRELIVELERFGARVITWPEIQIVDPESFTALDEAIDNVFGYDWLLFTTDHAAEFFLRRLQDLGHEISELDTLRVCAIGDSTVAKLEASQVHIDLIPNAPRAEAVFEAIESYAGGHAALGRLNFLIPRASMARDALSDMMEDAGARVDMVATYRTVSHNHLSLTQINTLLAGGGIDCLVLTDPESVKSLAELFDSNDLSTILDGVVVVCMNEETKQTAGRLELNVGIIPTEPSVLALVRALTTHLAV
jgi:uroporphyrinogen III methyltransferase/synthase